MKNQLINILLPSGIICLAYWSIWSIKYPKETWEYLTFQVRDTKSDIVVSFLVLLFFVGWVLTVVYLVQKFLC